MLHVGHFIPQCIRSDDGHLKKHTAGCLFDDLEWLTLWLHDWQNIGLKFILPEEVFLEQTKQAS